jgi:trimethylguanosine synthase
MRHVIAPWQTEHDGLQKREEALRAMTQRHVRVEPLPAWLDLRKLLGPHGCEIEPVSESAVRAHMELTTPEAADLSARLRGVGLAGAALHVSVEPALPRAAVRAARTDEARRMRRGGEGFARQGVRFDEEGRRSLTQEALALVLGRRAKGVHVIDACCGVGGNAIGFARAGCHVTAIELDAERIAMARHNARIYQVADRITFVRGDARSLLPTLDADLLFIDPPWGSGYDKSRVTLDELPLLAALWPERSRYAQTWIKVPPSFDPSELEGVTPSAMFGSGEGDAHRVKFLLLATTNP